jgi:hypothetical protein
MLEIGTAGHTPATAQADPKKNRRKMTTKNTDEAKIKELIEGIKGIIEKALKGELDRPPMLITSNLKHKLDLGGVYHHQPSLERVYFEARQLATNLGCEDIPPYQEKPLIGLQELQQCLVEKLSETGGEVEGNKVMKTSKENWEVIKGEYDISKKDFGKKINFVSDSFKREIIFRDVEHAFVLASEGYSKPALILAGGVIEELLRLYLEHKHIKPKNKRFVDYIEACEDNDLLKRGVSRLTDSIRDFRNLVHLDNEKTKRHTVSKATAKGAVSSIFTIANDFQ